VLWYNDPFLGIAMLELGMNLGLIVVYTGLLELVPPHLYGKGFSF
jgi:hypothetical protein